MSSAANIGEGSYFPGLDALRGWAIIGVMGFHWGVLDFGWAGVFLFFVLSGFLITSILQRTKARALGAYLKRFYWRRILRIFPLYFGILALAALAWVIWQRPTGFGDQAPWLTTFTYNIFMMGTEWDSTMTFHHFWSLSLEEQYYLLWPLLVFFLSSKMLKGLCWALVLLSPVIRWLFAWQMEQAMGGPEGVGSMTHYFPLGHLDAFAWGGLLASGGLSRLAARPGRWLVLSTGVAVVVGLVSLILLWQHGSQDRIISLGYTPFSIRNGQHIWGYSLIGMVAVSMVAYALQGAWTASRWAWLREVGKVSYGMYLIHWPLYMVWIKFWPPSAELSWQVLSFVPFVLLVFSLSWMIKQVYENRFLALKDRKFL